VEQETIRNWVFYLGYRGRGAFPPDIVYKMTTDEAQAAVKRLKAALDAEKQAQDVELAKARARSRRK
jgi:hypothetical protein